MPSWMKWAIAIAIGVGIIGIGFRVSWGAYILKPFFILNCLVLVIVVLLQSGKAADLAGAFGGAGSQTAFGPRGAANVLSKATTWCAVMFMLCAFAMTLRTDKAVEQGGGSVLQNVSTPAPKTAPAKTPAVPQSNTPTPSTPTHDALPAGQQPATQAPAATPQSNPPATQQQPASKPPASSQPSSAPTKKP